MTSQAMTDEHFQWLKENIMPRDRWLASENAKPLINELCDLGLMQPAYGEFGPMRPPSGGDAIPLLGKSIPVIGTLVSLYRLTRYGQTVYRAMEASQ